MSALDSCQEIIGSIWATGPEESRKSILITSSVSGEGVSDVAYNLAKVLAEVKGARVCLIDAAFRHPSVHRRFDFKNTVGFSDLLQGQVGGISGVLQKTHFNNLFVITSGVLEKHQASNIDPQKVREIIEELNDKFDFLIFDSSGVCEQTDPLILAGQVDGVVMVVQAGRTRWEVAQKGKEQIEFAGANLLGVVLNRRKYYIPRSIYRNL